jgi:muconolactone delta-isomerase
MNIRQFAASSLFALNTFTAVTAITTVGLVPAVAIAQPTSPGTAMAGKPVKYVVSWRERSGGSAIEYEAAQKRVLQLFQQWAMPETLKFEQFLVRVGDYGGYAVVQTGDVGALHKMTSAFAVFQFKVETVMDVMDAVAVEVDAIKWRDATK